MKKITFIVFSLITSIGFSQNLVTNGDFQTGAATPWYNNAANVVDLGGGNFVNQAQVLAPGNPWDANLSQDVVLLNGKTYRMSFDAFTDGTTGTRTMIAGLGQNNAPYSALTQTPVLTSTPQNFSYDFTINYGDAVTDRVIFDMGAAVGFVFIDNVSVTEVVDTAPPTAFTATIGTIAGTNVELLLNATDDSGSVIYNISYNSGANTVQTTGTSGVQKSFKVTGLTPLTSYTFSVTATDAAGNTAANNPISINATTIADTNTACAGTSTEAREGSFSAGYNYTIETLAGGTSVKYTIEILDTDKNGLCCAQLHKIAPDAYINMTNTVGKTFVGTVTGLTPGQVISYAGRFPYEAGGLVETKLLEYTVGDNCTLGTSNFDLVSFKAYPNPTKNSWTVTTNDTAISSIEVYDILGKNVLSLKPSASEAIIDASSLKIGLYFATINTINGFSTIKLVKE